MEKYLGAVACVIGLSAGQILFKLSSQKLGASKTIFDVNFLGVLGSAMALYAIVSVAWVAILQNAQLNKLYPIMALSFVVVPLASAYFFNEKLSLQYGIGVVVIIVGIMIAVSAPGEMPQG